MGREEEKRRKRSKGREEWIGGEKEISMGGRDREEG
jgi:hypothetical protein